MIDIALLATTVVAKFLVPLAKDGVVKVAQKITEQFGEPTAKEVSGIGQNLMDKATSLLSEDNERKALDLFKSEPDQLAGLITKLLRQKLEQSPVQASEFQKLIDAPTPAGGQTGAQIMNATYAGIFDARGANITGGVQAGLIVGAIPNVPPGGPGSGNPKGSDSTG